MVLIQKIEGLATMREVSVFRWILMVMGKTHQWRQNFGFLDSPQFCVVIGGNKILPHSLLRNDKTKQNKYCHSILLLY